MKRTIHSVYHRTLPLFPSSSEDSSNTKLRLAQNHRKTCSNRPGADLRACVPALKRIIIPCSLGIVLPPWTMSTSPALRSSAVVDREVRPHPQPTELPHMVPHGRLSKCAWTVWVWRLGGARKGHQPRVAPASPGAALCTRTCGHGCPSGCGKLR